jgi:predicted CoA-binding protein
MDPDQKVTLVLGASSNPDRVSYDAVINLQLRNIPVIAVGRKEYSDGNIKILITIPGDLENLHTVSLYMNATNQQEYYDAILSLRPKRIIFNPGTLNPELAEMAVINGVEVVEACMMEMLSNGEF